MKLKMVTGPHLPKHLSFDRDGLLFLYIKAAPGSLPVYFAKPSLAHTNWETLVFGLESDRFKIRQHFTQWLTEATNKNNEKALQRLGNLLGGCYYYLYGGRYQDKDAANFYDWLFANLQRETNPATKKIWARGLSCCPRAEAKPLCEEFEVDYLALAPREITVDNPFAFLPDKSKLSMIVGETGHVPADHVSVLYLLSSKLGCLGDIYFEQALLCERSVYEEVHEDEDAPKKPKKKKIIVKDLEVFRERDFIEVSDLDAYFGSSDPKWLRLRAYRAGEVLSATVKGNGDFRDIEGVVGFLNNVLQYYSKEQRLAVLSPDDENLTVLAGAKKELLVWCDQGLILFGEEAYDE
jgi:hypothetical protein